MLLAGTLWLSGVAATPTRGGPAPTATRTPPPALSGRVLPGSGEIQDGESLQSYAMRRRLTPVGPKGARTLPGRVRVISYSERPQNDDLAVEVVVENLLARPLDLLLQLRAVAHDGSPVTVNVRSADGERISPGAEVSFTTRIPRARPGSVELIWLDPVGLSGTIETSRDSETRRAEKSCLSFRVINPNAPEASQSVEVRAVNRCAGGIAADRTWFVLTLRDRDGRTLGHRFGSFGDAIPASGEARRLMMFDTPAGMRVEVQLYDPANPSGRQGRRQGQADTRPNR